MLRIVTGETNFWPRMKQIKHRCAKGRKVNHGWTRMNTDMGKTLNRRKPRQVASRQREQRETRIAGIPGSNVDYGAAAVVVGRVAGRDDAAKVNARTAGAGEDIEDERHDGN